MSTDGFRRLDRQRIGAVIRNPAEQHQPEIAQPLGCRMGEGRRSIAAKGEGSVENPGRGRRRQERNGAPAIIAEPGREQEAQQTGIDQKAGDADQAEAQELRRHQAEKPPMKGRNVVQKRSRSQSSIRRRDIESLRGSLKVESSGESSSWALVIHCADSSSLLSTVKFSSRASALKPTISEAGNGQGCEPKYLMRVRRRPTSSKTSRATASSRLSPGSTKPASTECMPGAQTA